MLGNDRDRENSDRTNRWAGVFSKRLRDLRLNRRMTQGEIAAQVGRMGGELSQGFMARMEGEGVLPNYGLILLLSRVFEVTPDYFNPDLDDPTARRVSDMSRIMATVDDATGRDILSYALARGKNHAEALTGNRIGMVANHRGPNG